ncbi:MAG: hypothetical protein KJ676_12890 [Alphaproteobacteria bacterium]|nr:hypothetical protein [Alphaproteobacteria bacterium]MBU1525672.1 hypothetical protein [Alphaproteobacteria bacterium]MBU2118348.1 hypothetical protein [Alphaproteobacteria bacterium]MBU2351947.1 hypothetical protein [Alphaproteobacteria bacterium]MBU2383724.1 hypothetical protein [Alphaproteobacteria bacterium]
MRALLIGLLVAAQAAGLQDPPPPTRVDDVVVEGHARRPDPFTFFAALCFDGNRLDGHAVRPVDDTRWRQVAVPASNDQDPATGETFLLSEGDLTIVLTINEGLDPESDRVQRNTCSLTLVGPHDQAVLERRMSALFGGAGTSRHLDFMPLVFPTHPGWVQLAWSAIPARSSSNWTAFQARGASGPGFVVVTDPGFYRRSRWVVAELRHSDDGGVPISHMSLLHQFRSDDAR